ncbi:MAG: protein translocase subunit SecD, partial [Zoogloeaceae bacterium]|nr:protein translocase subunit SecD [Zoogloeaceae bacterium]
MNRYPLWKYITVALALVLGFIYTLPNFFGETPAVQVSSNRATLKVDAADLPRIEGILKEAGVTTNGLFVDQTGIKARLQDEDAQLKAHDALGKALNPDGPDNADYVVALNQLTNTPAWLLAIGARPMYLGLDLRGGVHFLFQVDMAGAEQKRLDSTSADLRVLLRDKNLRHAGISREGSRIVLNFRDAETLEKAKSLLANNYAAELVLTEVAASEANKNAQLIATLRPEGLAQLREDAVKQNISTLRNRINELGVSEPVIIQQGADRIVVQLPGIQDPGEAKKILGRTATLEIRMVDDSLEAQRVIEEGGTPPFGTEVYKNREGRNIVVQKQVALTGERLTKAQTGFDKDSQPAVHLSFDSAGARIFRDLTHDNVNKRMAILLIEKGRGEVVTAPVI